MMNNIKKDTIHAKGIDIGIIRLIFEMNSFH